jgi:type II secretory pathway pseudopilin PulG
MFHSLLSNILTASLCLGLSQFLSVAVLAQNSTKPLTSDNAAETTIREVPELVGQWALKDFFPYNFSAVFTPEGKLYVFSASPWFSGVFGGGGGSSIEKPMFYEVAYKINTSTKPMQLDILLGSDKENIKTILEMTPDGKIRIEYMGLTPGAARPTEFSVGSLLLEKVSNITKLPRNSQITNAARESKRAVESEARTYIGAMVRAQQAYFLEHNKFARNIQDLQIGIKSETENYSYRILPQGNQKRHVMMTASAKKSELKSYTGVVYIVPSKKEKLTMAAICETANPSTTAPAKPKIPTKLSEKVQCPAGSVLR